MLQVDTDIIVPNRNNLVVIYNNYFNVIRPPTTIITMYFIFVTFPDIFYKEIIKYY